MVFRIATLNLEQDHKRWEQRRELILAQSGDLRPDVFTLNEVCVPLQTARWIQQAAGDRLGIRYALIQQTKVNSTSLEDGEAILSRFPVVETPAAMLKHAIQHNSQSPPVSLIQQLPQGLVASQ
jgi:hypothetical protein